MTHRIAIIGSALSGNKGAAAMLESAVQTLGERVPDVGFTLFSMYPAEDRALVEDPRIEIVPAAPRQLGVTINLLALLFRVLPPLRGLLRRRSRAVRALVEADVLLDQGGITFSDGREKFLLYNVASVLPALLVGTPVVKCAQAVGPFTNPVNRLAARLVLPRMRLIVTRGRITHDHAVGLGLTNLLAGADYAFCLATAGDEDARARAALDHALLDGPHDDGLLIGLSPSVVLARKVEARGGDYVGEMVAFVDQLTGDGHRVLLAPHSVRTGTDATHNNDLPLCRTIHGRLAHPDRVAFLDREVPSQVLRHLIGRCDAFVTSRFHAMVSGLAMATPTLVIGWSHKYVEVLEMFGQERWAIAHDELAGDELRRRFDELLAERDAVAAAIAEHLPEVRTRALLQADAIAAAVTGA